MFDNAFRHRLGAVVGGVAAAVLTQAALVPHAHADDPVSDLLNNVQTVTEVGYSYLNLAETDFSAGYLMPGSAAGLIGLDNILIGPEENALLDSVDIWTNTPVHAVIGFEPISGIPTDWASTLVEVQGFTDAANVDFTEAVNFMNIGDFAAAEFLDIEGFNALWVDAPNATILGLLESLINI